MSRLYGCEKLIVGRGATGVCAVLEANKDRLGAGANIVVPANADYSLVYPIVLNGFVPVFTDVDAATGNVVYEDVVKAVEQNNAVAVIVPHMYGNPVSDIISIGDYCNAKGIMLIEDCSLAAGAYTADGAVCFRCGSIGDYAVYSTGASKTVDVGCGGFVIQNTQNFADLSEVSAIYETYCDKSVDAKDTEKFFLDLYEMIREAKPNDLSKTIWESFCADNAKVMRDFFAYKDESCEEPVEKALKDIDDMIAQRREKAQLYTDYLKKCEKIEIYSFEEGSVPWMFCFKVNKRQKGELFDYLKNNNVLVKNCYPAVISLFGNDPAVYKGALEMEQEMICIPLMVENDEIIRVCWLINNFFDD